MILRLVFERGLTLGLILGQPVHERELSLSQFLNVRSGEESFLSFAVLACPPARGILKRRIKEKRPANDLY